MFYNPKITMAFSGYNIKNMATLSIDSLLKIYPQMKSQIIYFDDCSTDGTREELRSRGIKVISWDASLLCQYNHLITKNQNWSITQRLSVRVAFIIENIVRQTETDYLLLNDGDVIFLRAGFLEEFTKQAEEGFDIIYDTQDTFVGKSPSTEKLADYINANYKSKVAEGNCNYYYWRMTHSHIFLNIKKLKEIGITSDRLDEATLSYMEGGIFDTFIDFSNRVVDSGLVKTKKEQLMGRNVLHIGGHACVQRGFPLGIISTLNPNGEGYITLNHLYWPNNGMQVERDYVVVDLNKDLEELREQEFREISHILNNGYAIKEIYTNKNKNIYKISFEKIQYPSRRVI